jgi:type IV pilus assembly protein PilQ
MLSRIRATTTSKAAAAVALLLFSLTACQQPKPQPPPPPPKVLFNETYDREIQEILDLARQNRWEDAQTKATALYQQDPKNPIVARVNSWVTQQSQQRRSQALEDKIRNIDAKNSVFNPTIPDLLTEKKDRGLPARKDVRDMVDRIENTPYIPDTYGKTIREKGPLFDLESTKGHMAKVLEKEVSIHVDNVPLETILVNLSQTSGINIVADKSLPALKQVLSANLDKVRLEEFLRYIGRNYELQFQVGNELVWVVDAKDTKKLMEETRFYRLRKGFVLPAQFGAPETTKQTVTAGAVNTVTETQKFTKFVNDDAPTLPALERAITKDRKSVV